MSTYPVLELAYPAELHPVQAPGAGERIALLDLDPDLGDAVPPAQLGHARRVLTVPCVRIDAGEWRVPDFLQDGGSAWGLVLVDGLLVQHLSLGERVCSQLFASGDVLDPWAGSDGLLSWRVRWQAHGEALAGVLDGSFAAAVRRWPQLAERLERRLLDQARRVATHNAISQLPTVEQRILAIFWQLAERHGQVCRDGVVMPLRLTHQLIGQLIGARRPSVTLGLRELGAKGWLLRVEERGWLLPWQSRRVISC